MKLDHCTRWLTAVLAVVMMVSLQPIALAQSEPVEIEVFRSSLTGDTDRALIEISKLFMEQNPGIKVNFTVATGNYNDALITRILAGEAPDLSGLVGTLVAEFAENGLLRDIYPYAEADGLQLDELLIPMAVEYGEWRGELVAAPLMVQPFATYYNVTFFQEAGLSDPMSLARAGEWNWESVAAAAQRLTQDLNGDGVSDRWGIAHGAGSISRMNVFINTAGGSFIEPGAPPYRSALNTPEVLKAFEYFDRLINELQVMPPPHGRTNSTRFETGNSAMTFEGPWQIGTNRVAGLEYEWDVAPIPHGPDNDGSNIHIGGMQMPAGSKNPEAAWEFLKFVLTDHQAAEIFMRITGRPHALMSALPDYFRIQLEEGQPKNVMVLGDMLLHPKSAPMIPNWPAQRELASALESRVQAAYEGKLNMAIALQLAHDDWNVIFDRFNNKD